MERVGHEAGLNDSSEALAKKSPEIGGNPIWAKISPTKQGSGVYSTHGLAS